MRQQNPFIDSRSKVPYLINAPSGITTRNATLRPFFDICHLFQIPLPDYFRFLPQADKELGQYVYSEAFLKSKNDLYILNISNAEMKYALYADVDMNDFSIRRIEKEEVISLIDGKHISSPSVLKTFSSIRERFFEMNQTFHREFYGRGR
jgi:hypothetical protein